VLQVKWRGDGICSEVGSGYTGRLGSRQGFETRRMIHCAPHMRNGRLRTLPYFFLLLSDYCAEEFASCRHAQQQEWRYQSVAHLLYTSTSIIQAIN